MNSTQERALAQSVPIKVAWRLIPLLVLAYVLGQLDRVNVSFAALTMNADLGFSASVYGLGAGLFFIGYIIFQIPSNLVLERFGARRLLAGIMMVWGIISAATAFVENAPQFYIIRTLLGAAESGLYPGAMLYLTYWFGEKDRATAIAWFSLAVPVAGVFGSPLSGWILQVADGWSLLTGWQWLFVIEGLPSVLLALIVLLLLTDRPEQAAWLTDEERSWLAEETSKAHSIGEAPGSSFKRAILHPATWVLSIAYFFFAGALVGSLYWLPKLLASVSPGMDKATLGWLIGLPYALFGVGSIYWGRHSDRSGERRWHVLSAGCLAALGLAGLAIAQGTTTAVLGMCTLMLGGGATFSTFWGLTASSLKGSLGAVGMATVNILGSLGSFATIYLVGILYDATGGYLWGFTLLVTATLVAALMAPLVPRTASAE